jgi:hypothetical protein
MATAEIMEGQIAEGQAIECDGYPQNVEDDPKELALRLPVVLFEICRRLDELRQLGILACVSKSFNAIAGSDTTARALFAERWQLRAVEGSPPDRSFWSRALLRAFALEHAPLRKTDTLSSLALEHGVDLAQLKRINGCMNDTALASRERAFVPISSPEQLQNRRAVVQQDLHTRRVIAVLTEREQDALQMSVLSDAKGADAVTPSTARAVSHNLSVPDAEARAYLALADGDARMACALAREDKCWESSETAGEQSSAGKNRWWPNCLRSA